MPTLFLLCGLPGSGKTTLAKQLEKQQQACRFTPDEWIGALSFDPYDEERRSTIETLQWQVASQVLRLGIDVILDWGFWSRIERDNFRERASTINANTKVIYLNTPRDVLLKRLTLRNKQTSQDTFHVNESQLDLWTSWFEPPSPEELD